MKAKVDYNPNNRTGVLYYTESDVMLVFPYEHYKTGDTLAINIPVDFDESFKRRRDEILNFIGAEVAARQPVPSFYKITATSVTIQKTASFYRLKSGPVQCVLAILLLILGGFMSGQGIVLGREIDYTHSFRRSIGPIDGTTVIIVAIIWLISLYYNRKKRRGRR